ncbi:hypothetical protein [Pantanalinema sp. GBBB05]|uniref:hypothetical protein n=1 Tax=Pantanalinema sp. GBBB05 TaxID=2604139 RepID=UPI001DAB47B6|nr:hypothetical protein [Pantanalinema sp. GBBB05]
MEQPQANDVILGGQTPPPISSAILGGIVGLHQQLIMALPEQRSQLLATALNYSEVGIDLLISILNDDPVLTIRATAYQLLQSVDSEKTNEAIANGILLNPGDRFYCVCKSAITYGDDWYSLNDSVFNSDYWTSEDFTQSYFIPCSQEEEINVIVQKNEIQNSQQQDLLTSNLSCYTIEQDFEEDYSKPTFDADGCIYINLDSQESEFNSNDYHDDHDYSDYGGDDWIEELIDRSYRPELVSRHIFQETAELLAEALHQELTMRKETPAIYDFEGYPNNFQDWCLENKISVTMSNMNRVYDLDEVTDFLKRSKNYQLLGKLWRDLLGNLAFVHEEIVQQPTYLLIRGKL